MQETYFVKRHNIQCTGNLRKGSMGSHPCKHTVKHIPHVCIIIRASIALPHKSCKHSSFAHHILHALLGYSSQWLASLAHRQCTMPKIISQAHPCQPQLLGSRHAPNAAFSCACCPKVEGQCLGCGAYCVAAAEDGSSLTALRL